MLRPDFPVRTLQNPDYTGANRCIPCTVVNAVLALVGSATLAAFVRHVTGSIPVAAATLVVAVSGSACLIYLRGYLVPGTPTLTKRYLPERVLALFGKGPEADVESPTPGHADPAETPETADPETYLTEVGVLTASTGADDSSLDSGFRDDWGTRTDAASDGPIRDRLADVFEGGDTATEVADFGAGLRLHRDGETVATWPSRAAAVADLSADDLLAARDPAWTERSTDSRLWTLRRLRWYLETCPACEGDLRLDEKTVETCCRTYAVYTLDCIRCGARLCKSTQWGDVSATHR